MGEGGMFPLAGIVTAIAFAAIAAGMLVVMLVTIVTGGTQLDTVKLAGMTGIAAYGGMGTGQLEFCILVMIEEQLLPFPFVMALLAFLAVAAGMNVIDAVAGYAFPS
jgi:hypothetical protein